MLQVQGVFKSYATPLGPLAVLAGVDLHLGARSSLALMGESGSGKSTLFDPQWQAQLVERLGLGDLLKRYPEQLSGGQQQRVAVGRALASRPGLLLADEPTGNLDEATSDEVLQLLLDLLRDSPTSLLMVTHSPRIAARLDRQVVLHHAKVVPT